HPDPEIFKHILEFSFEQLGQKLRELAYLNSGLEIVILDERNDKQQSFKFEGGITTYVADLNANKTAVSDPIAFTGEHDGATVDVAMQWNDGYSELVTCFTNTIKNRDGGTHLTGFRQALTRTVRSGRPRRPSCSSSRVRAPAARPSRAAIARSRRSCRSRARS